MSTNTNVKKLFKQSSILKPKSVIIFDEQRYLKHKKKFISKKIKVFADTSIKCKHLIKDRPYPWSQIQK